MTVDDQIKMLLRNADRVEPPDGLVAKLSEGRPLRVKLGLDPTAPAVTLGWVVVLSKLRQFQDLGHTAVLIVGDFTARVGDPSGKSETRRALSKAEVDAHAASVLTQFRKVLSDERLEIRYNSEWLEPLDMSDVLSLTAKTTVAQMLERGDFAERYSGGTPISLMEFMYPLLQAYDSVAVQADVELGGSDQLWNLMMGRTIQERYGQPPQVALTVPLLIGTDGTQKMSQSLGNYIGVDDEPADMFGKVMSIPDELMPSWFSLLLNMEPDEVTEITRGMADGRLHPGAVKRRLARAIVGRFHGDPAAEAAEAAFDAVFKRGEVPDEVPEAVLGPEDPVFLPTLLKETGLTTSSSEGRRLIDQGAVKVDGERIETIDVPRDWLAGRVLQVGKRRFLRLVDPPV